MNKIYKLLTLLICFITISGLVYATATIANDRKSTKIPWQGTSIGYYDEIHNVGTSYSPESRFIFTTGSIAGGTSIVLDNITGLYWQSDGSNGVIFDNARIYCEDLLLGGYSDWKLPNIKELNSIVDFSVINPSIDTNYFTAYNAAYVSSVPYADNASGAWYVYFASGHANYNYNVLSGYVRCVRND